MQPLRTRLASAFVVAAILASTFVIAIPATAASGSTPGPVSGPARLKTLLQHRLHDARLGRNVAVIVVREDTGQVLFAHAANRPMQAASNMKLVTAATALATLGPRHRFATRVLAGTRAGDLILQGGGDPLLTRRDLEELATRTAKVTRRAGQVVVHVDGDLFGKPSRGPGWVDGYLGNSVGLTQALGVRGDRSKHPARNAASIFTNRLRELGFRARLGANSDAAADAAVLAGQAGHTVSRTLAVMLRESDSGIAEVLFRHVALAAGRATTWAGSRRAAMETLRDLGLNPDALILLDGSGLSRDDRLTPRFLAELLQVVHASQTARFAAMFAHDALPTAGRTGTLTAAYGRYSSFPSRCAAGRVQAKTGTIPGTIALSGVARTPGGGRRIFSIIVNSRPTGYSALATRQAVDGLAATIAGCWR